jgi:hypothetical protein
VDGTGSGSCPVSGFGISGVEPSGSATRELLIFRLMQSSVFSLYVPFMLSAPTAHAVRPLP